MDGSTQGDDSIPTAGNFFKIYDLKPEQELRFEVEDRAVTLQLKSGKAEIFGTELRPATTYTLDVGSKVAVYTFFGCSLRVGGKPEGIYVSQETPMMLYLNLHGYLEQRREQSEDGPVVMVIGPADVGKSTLCRILINWAIKSGHTPMYADLDLGQGAMSLPGTISIAGMDKVMEPAAPMFSSFPLTFHIGSLSPDGSVDLYNQGIGYLANAMTTHFENNKKARRSGCIINTCGWVTGQGYKSLLHTAKLFSVDYIFVIDHERLYNEMKRDLDQVRSLKIVPIPKSGGVVVRTKKHRHNTRESRINDYFYGNSVLGEKIYPHKLDVPFAQLKLFKVVKPTVPVSCLPLGMAPTDSQMSLQPVTSLTHLAPNHLVSVSFAKVDKKEDALKTNIMSFCVISSVDHERGTITFLCPQPRPFPSDHCLLISNIQYIDMN